MTILHAIDGGHSPGEQTFPSVTVPPRDGTNTSAVQQLIHAQQELFLQQKIRELARHYQSRSK
jgi:hypothetical protein